MTAYIMLVGGYGMMRKIRHILLAMLLLVVVVLGYGWYQNQQRDEGNKTIEVTIQVDEEVIYTDSVQTDAARLGDLLAELKQQGELLLEVEESAYGRFITGMGKDQLYMQDTAAGRYWTYSSDNNATCVADGYCSGIDSLDIQDGDRFVFTLGQ